MERNTHQKQMVLNTVRCLSGSHPTADTIYQNVRKVIPSISKATVYRILDHFSEQNTILRVKLPAATDRFDCRNEPHYHVHCLDCGQVGDMDLPEMDMLWDKASSVSDYRITGYSVSFSGLCPKCQEEQKTGSVPR